MKGPKPFTADHADRSSLPMSAWALLVMGLCGPCTAATNATGPAVILSVIIDDMGLYDAQPWNPISPTPTLGALTRDARSDLVAPSTVAPAGAAVLPRASSHAPQKVPRRCSKQCINEWFWQ